jgi:hypothetical protein
VYGGSGFPYGSVISSYCTDVHRSTFRQAKSCQAKVKSYETLSSSSLCVPFRCVEDNNATCNNRRQEKNEVSYACKLLLYRQST